MNYSIGGAWLVWGQSGGIEKIERIRPKEAGGVIGRIVPHHLVLRARAQPAEPRNADTDRGAIRCFARLFVGTAQGQGILQGAEQCDCRPEVSAEKRVSQN